MAGAEGPTYREYPPSSALATAVQCYWTMTARGATPFTNRVLPDRRPPRGIRRTEQFLLDRLRSARVPHPLVFAAVHLLQQSRGRTSVTGLEHSLGIGGRQLEPLAGLAPRAFAAERAQVGFVQDGAAAGA